MNIFVLPLRVQLAFYAFALTLPTAAIWSFSLVSGIPVQGGFYVLGAVVSIVVFWIFFVFMWNVMAWDRALT
ncbi:hypothetical protein [Massilia sp. BSC265]|uniref:hypothetical protein n=1 Tax=Massilia sp. BSC265 TaxID=1549812 RepID=UPI00126A5CA1|nr:hypothetical protein [Massilia sp. BSC265]